MIKHSATSGLLHNLLKLLEQHRRAFRQERSYWRVVGLVLGEVFNFGRHTVTQGLMALGLTEADWSGWYRLFSRGRYAEHRAARIFLRETVSQTSPEEPYVVGVDGVQIPRSSLKLAGTSWLKALRTPVFKVGIHRAQRFVHGAYSMGHLFPPVGGPARPAGRSIRSSVNTAWRVGELRNFRPCGHEPRATGSKKKPSSWGCSMR